MTRLDQSNCMPSSSQCHGEWRTVLSQAEYRDLELFCCHGSGCRKLSVANKAVDNKTGRNLSSKGSKPV